MAGGKPAFTPGTSPRVGDPETDRILQNHDRRISEVVGVPIVQGRLFRGVELPSGVDTIIRHGFGRRVSVFISPPYPSLFATGRIGWKSDDADDPKNQIMLRATGFGATVYVDAWVF